MAAWCLPRNLSTAFVKALTDGTLTPERLMEMSSTERRAEFAKIIGPENAHEINVQFESKMLLKDQKAGLTRWAQNAAGLTEPARRDIIARISRMDRILNTGDDPGLFGPQGQAFLADLAAKKLGVAVTEQEAKEIFDLAQNAERLRAQITAAGQGDYRAGWTKENGTAYGRAQMALTDKIESLKPHGQTFANKVVDVLNIPKTALTSILHFSAPFVQGWGMLSTKVAWQGFGQMFAYFQREENYANLNAYILSHPDYVFAKDGKLGLTKLGDVLTSREEAIQSTLVEQANEWLSEHSGLPNLVRMSSRAFTGYLNFVRFNRFVDLLNAARMHGENISVGSSAVHDLAKVVNDFTGRGTELSLGLASLEIPAGAVPALNALFFSPRKILATVEMFNPVRYADPRISNTARMAAVRQLGGSILATGAVMAIAKAMGAQVIIDPRDQNFAKIQVGSEKLDMTGGNAVYTRLLARLISNREITSRGKDVTLGEGYNAPTRADLVGQYMRGKLSPVAGFMVDALYGKDPVGRPFNLSDELRDKVSPIFINSVIEAFMNNPDGAVAVIPALAGIVGVGVESPLPPISHSGMSVWGDPLIGGPSFAQDPVNQEAQKIGLYPTFPMDKIRGVKLTPGQFDDYVHVSGNLAHQRLEQVIGMQSWDAIPTGQRLKLMKSVIRRSRESAAASIMIEAQGTPNDILKQSTDAKIAAMGVAAP